jgi:hypothetical protein
MRFGKWFAQHAEGGVRLLSALLLLAVFGMALPQPAQAAPSSVVGRHCALYYQIDKGETWSSIARSFGISVGTLRDANQYAKFKEGKFLCIPWINILIFNPKIDFHAALYLDRWVVVWGDNLPKKHTYYVNFRLHRDDPFIRLGTVRTNDKGVLEKYLKLPWYLVQNRYPRYMEVCLKDIEHGCTICTWVMPWN